MGCSCIPRAGREGPETPLPKFRVFVLLCITVSEGFSLNMLFPFVSYMVRSFGYTSAADVGRHAAVCVCVCVCVCVGVHGGYSRGVCGRQASTRRSSEARLASHSSLGHFTGVFCLTDMDGARCSCSA